MRDERAVMRVDELGAEFSVTRYDFEKRLQHQLSFRISGKVLLHASESGLAEYLDRRFTEKGVVLRRADLLSDVEEAVMAVTADWG